LPLERFLPRPPGQKGLRMMISLLHTCSLVTLLHRSTWSRNEGRSCWV
jgi:hypothetical protein